MIIAEPCIHGIDDTDLYKFSVMKAYLAHCPGVCSTFEFVDRNPHGLYNQNFLDALKEQIIYIGTLRTEPETIDFLWKSTPWLGREYLEYLRNFKPNPDLVEAKLDDGQLRIRISGPIEEASPWEIYLMSTISELNFKLIQTDWAYDGQMKRICEKNKLLSGVLYSEFGTR
jgi:nicotinate phosphoribosyltransferase